MDSTTSSQAGTVPWSMATVSTPPRPPMTMMPSSAMLMMPECSLNMPPSATSIKTMPYSRVYLTSSSISLALLLRFGALRPAGDQAAEQHGERAQVDDDAGDHVWDLGREIACGQERTADRDVRDKQRGEDGADRVRGRQQRRGDAVEAHGGQRCGVEGVPLGA